MSDINTINKVYIVDKAFTQPDRLNMRPVPGVPPACSMNGPDHGTLQAAGDEVTAARMLRGS
jgi:hypothetical protein